VFFQSHAFRVSVAVGEVDDAHLAAQIVDAAHQPAGTENFVVRVRSDDEQTGVRVDGQCPRRRHGGQRGEQGKQQRAAHWPDEPASPVPGPEMKVWKPHSLNAPAAHPV